ncbi:MAG: Rrf2 family transcriptional regulator [bacterium]|nr:Rrf2 family transcriptional regulator [bacterium]
MPTMLRISEAASLGMHAMGLMSASQDQPLSARTIAEKFSVSEAHLSKVLQRLTKVGLLASTRGPKGGFSLTRDPETVTLLEVFEAIEGPVEPTDCLFGSPLCDGNDCVLGRVIVDVNRTLWDYLAKKTLKDISLVFEQHRIQIQPTEAHTD